MSQDRQFRKVKDYEIDPKTNMPVVPEGHFWRVKFHEDDYRGRSVQVSLRKKMTSVSEWFWYNWFGTTREVHAKSIVLRVEGTKVWNSDGYYSEKKVDPSDYPAIIAEAYESVLAAQEEYLEELEYSTRAKAEIAKLSGDYPPKKLGE